MLLSLDLFFSLLCTLAEYVVGTEKCPIKKEGAPQGGVLCGQETKKNVLEPDYPSSSLLIVLLGLISFNLWADIQ